MHGSMMFKFNMTDELTFLSLPAEVDVFVPP